MGELGVSGPAGFAWEAGMLDLRHLVPDLMKFAMVLDVFFVEVVVRQMVTAEVEFEEGEPNEAPEVVCSLRHCCMICDEIVAWDLGKKSFEFVGIFAFGRLFC